MVNFCKASHSNIFFALTPKFCFSLLKSFTQITFRERGKRIFNVEITFRERGKRIFNSK